MSIRGTVILLLVLGGIGCAPDQFVLYRSQSVFAIDEVARGIILSHKDYDNVEVFDKACALRLRDGAVVALRRFEQTQYQIKMRVSIPEQGTLTLYTQAQVLNSTVLDSGVALRLNAQKWQLEDRQHRLGGFSHSQTSSWAVIQFDRFGDRFQCIVNCDTLTVSLKRPATDWLLIRAPQNQTVEIRQVQWALPSP